MPMRASGLPVSDFREYSLHVGLQWSWGLLPFTDPLPAGSFQIGAVEITPHPNKTSFQKFYAVANKEKLKQLVFTHSSQNFVLFSSMR